MHHIEGMHVEVTIRSNVLLQVEADCGSGHTSSREAEDDTRLVFEDEANTFRLRQHHIAFHKVEGKSFTMM